MEWGRERKDELICSDGKVKDRRLSEILLNQITSALPTVGKTYRHRQMTNYLSY